MRHWLAAPLAASLLLVLPAAVTEAAAQCTTGCSSSSSCNGNGRSGCMAQCNGAGECTCRDDDCTTQVLPPASLAPSSDLHFAQWTGATEAGATSLVVDCRGNVQGVLVYDARGEAVLGTLARIAVQPSAAAKRPRLAIRE